ncbi:cation/acetate symporter [Pseudomonas citronellolis]|uniref:Cation/acetate symporter ActP n=1 Tax=Pseudomonas citronellolis TaxID=53408 RepID=A0AAQ1KJK2_9PSED|nr:MULTISPECIES: cation acetate symporter [Pseudomonas]MCL6693472.1 cation acetate symporter [Pseudomonas sp. R3.Fl]TGC26397.1 cation acetate symporter [Pseudomonas citronellolis]UUC53332.1 cation acetate symporter [Pseudomonas citronellolis]SFD56748.1 cation/acetate symporter [Pseudomonas citronellolis]
MKRICAACLIALPLFAHASEAGRQEPNLNAIAMFVLFVGITLLITWWAARRTRSAHDFYTAGGGITGLQNGLAIAGDYMSASTLLGISSMVFAKGYDGMIYVTGFFVGWPVLTFLMAERLRNLGRYTFADIVSYRLDQRRIRILAACGSLTVVSCYLLLQMVGAGQLIKLLFGLDYNVAVVVVGVLMLVYVVFGGMLATTWVQITKAVLLLAGGTTLMLLALERFDFSLETLARRAVESHANGWSIMGPGSMLANPVNVASMAIGLVFGLAGLPHIMMRFFTVPNAREARKSVLYASGFIGFFFLVVCVLGYSSIVIVGTDPQYFVDGKLGGALLGGGNMVAMHLAKAVGGNLFLGFISAVAFATILAVVAGLTLAGASTISHDLYGMVYKRGQASEAQEMRISRFAVLGLGVLAIALGMLFEQVNIAFLVGLTFGIAASANFPVLIMAMYWKGLTTRGAIWGGLSGLIAALVLVVLSPTVWVTVLGHAKALFPYDHPALFAMPLAFGMIVVVSKLDRSARADRDREGFEDQRVRAETGLGIATALSH